MPPLRVIVNGDISQGLHPALPINTAKVFINNKLVMTTGDTYANSPGHPEAAGTHPSAAGPGSTTVFVGGKSIFRENDLLVCGDTGKVPDPTRNVYSG